MEQRFDADFEAYNKIYAIEKSTFNKEYEFNGNKRCFCPREEYQLKYHEHQYLTKKTGGIMIKHNMNIDKILGMVPKLSNDRQ
jgi:hypothetical protein